MVLSNSAQTVVKLKGFFLFHNPDLTIIRSFETKFSALSIPIKPIHSGHLRYSKSRDLWHLLFKFGKIWIVTKYLFNRKKGNLSTVFVRQNKLLNTVLRFNEVDRSKQERKHKVDLVLIILWIVVYFSYIHLFLPSAYILCVVIMIT